MRNFCRSALLFLAVATSACKEEGTIKVHSLKFNGVKAVDESRLKDALATKQSSKLPWGKKAYFDRSRFDADLKRIQAFYSDRGYPDARVTGFDVKLNDKQDQVDVTLTIAEGEPVMVAEVTFEQGDLYRRSIVQDSQRRLYGLELFQFANIEPLNPEAQPEDVPMRVTVAEGNHQRVNFGVGYGTEEKARIDSEYHHLNFFGGARSAGAHVRWSSLDRGVRLDFNQAYCCRPHISR